MPIQLTTAADSGEMGGGATYTHVKIMGWSHEPLQKLIKIGVQFGTMSGEEFIPGPSFMIKSIMIINDPGVPHTKYDDLVDGHTTNDGEKTYAAVKRGLYQWMIDESIFAGTIV